jgi:phosphoglucomutase/phosphomannomutase
VRWLPREIHEGYIRANLAAALGTTRSAKVVFSPLHGVGRDSCGAVLEEAGFDVDFVASQSTPDGAFPNVPFRSPNPEVAESLDAATRRAAEIGADLVLVSDPDADRIGMAVPDSERGWTRLSGDQIGLLLASWLFESRSRRGRRDGFAATTVVTTSLFRRVAESYGVETISDLGIGFKYIADVLGRIESMGEYRGFRGAIDDFVLGVEESHGYLVTHSVRDKDAAGAALLLAELISSLKDRGETALGHLDRIYLRYGYVANLLRSTVMTGAMGFIAIREVQRSLRDDPPRRIGDLEVLRFIDRHDETGPLGPFSSETDKAARDLLTFELEAGARVVLRPSGTESKNKIYVEVIGEPLGDRASTADLAAEKRAIDRRAATVAKDFLELALARIETAMPRWALDVSDLAPLEAKIRFGELFVEFVHRIECGAVDLSDWLEAALAPLGSDARLLVRGAVESYLRDENPPARVSSVLCELFELRPRSG